MKKLFFLLIFLVGCAGFTSPEIRVEKNVTNNIFINGEPCPIERCGSFLPVWINIENEYTTKSDFDTKLDTKQDIKPKTTIPFPGF